MNLGEWLLVRLSRPPALGDYFGGDESLNPDSSGECGSALALLREVIPAFDDRILGKRILDYGCGTGLQAVAMARAGAAQVVGLDIRPGLLDVARRRAATSGVADRVAFCESLGSNLRESFDAVVSQNSMEHFARPNEVLSEMKAVIPHHGEVLLTFSLPWFHPYGAHMHFFTKVPWVHLLFREQTVMRVRSRYRSDGAMRYEDVEGGLNKMSIRKFERSIRHSGFNIKYLKYDGIKGIQMPTRIPLIREVVANRVSAILIRQQSAS